MKTDADYPKYNSFGFYFRILIREGNGVNAGVTMLNNELLTIGKFSALTGVGIHSLRYYDEIGILKPEYVDPVSNYRYYSFRQLSLMPAIEICKDAGINLNRFGSFLHDGAIDYDKLLQESRESVEHMLRACRMKQKEMDLTESLIRIRNAVKDKKAMTVFLNRIPVWTTPYEGQRLAEDSSEKLVGLSASARKCGIQIAPSIHGILKECTGSQRYVFSYIMPAADDAASIPGVRYLPEGDYLVRPIDICSLEAAAGSFRSDSNADLSGVIMALSFICDDMSEPLYCGMVKTVRN